MDRTEAVLAAIDDTLAGHDGVVSDDGRDAMRWSPGRVICDGGTPMRIGPRPLSVSAPWHLVQVNPERAEAFSRALAAFTETLMTGMQQAADAFIAFGRTIGKALPDISKLAHEASHKRRHVRCRECNPHGNPLPLCIDGREYHRRQIARQRRRRRGR